MKKLITFFAMSTLTFLLSALEPYSLDLKEECAFIYSEKGESYIVLNYVGEYARLDDSVFGINEDGFMEFKYKGHSFIAIEGNFIQSLIEKYSRNSDIDYTKTPSWSGEVRNIKDISASSFLTETIKGNKINYSPDNLGKNVSSVDRVFTLQDEHIPWVEGKDDYGVGESITIKYTGNMAALTILNGYVDARKTKLYKENSRVKELEIEDLNTGKKQTVLFEDKVYYNYIPLDNETDAVKLTIKSVYQGTKYKDTCITSITGHPFTYKNYLPTYLEDNKKNWVLEDHNTVLDDYYSGMDLFKNKYRTAGYYGGM